MVLPVDPSWTATKDGATAVLVQLARVGEAPNPSVCASLAPKELHKGPWCVPGQGEGWLASFVLPPPTVFRTTLTLEEAPAKGVGCYLHVGALGLYTASVNGEDVRAGAVLTTGPAPPPRLPPAARWNMTRCITP